MNVASISRYLVYVLRHHTPVPLSRYIISISKQVATSMKRYFCTHTHARTSTQNTIMCAYAHEKYTLVFYILVQKILAKSSLHTYTLYMYKHLYTCVGPTHYYYVCLQFVRCRFTLRASCVGLDKQLFAQLWIHDTRHLFIIVTTLVPPIHYAHTIVCACICACVFA